ncbi:tRNA (adenosine(37)-N6)-threonylcarbamoyltransferase complex dimerization subunit type 1 TsaB [[Mycoplasma] anseris]|uniref:tRNA (Adenosine(37)-N6)-threonylcarbamoyltransferase complex dimerization subunit type 1 TsaB n=1 Tax=[Mycoplasma] anseris TaxID=92400 RepID=A0A2Z4NDR8_9BACT|nr:tRNA (adenosine(37)-N6)-threonylcarbamoyltransferase complex dimerization subunit type 1 TsaB [[Mycoplasma] anseris]AWX69646.1 tRNA (adenosine(37)-N6)-threonylcarbamoyltransferase complex dimerization subunit type 1 TsaB [[Mycoplasma] anseris]
MELFLETSLSSLYLALINNQKIIDKIELKALVKKTDALFEQINLLFVRNNVSINDIKKIKITIGPGSFSGARIALLYARSICQLSNIKLAITTTYELIKKQLELKNQFEGYIKIKANRYNTYLIHFDKLTNKFLSSEIIDEQNQYHELDYDFLETNFEKFETCFQEISDLMGIELCYLHDPQIGGL